MLVCNQGAEQRGVQHEVSSGRWAITRICACPGFGIFTHCARPSHLHELHPIYILNTDEQDTHSVALSFIYKSLYLYPITELSIKRYRPCESIN